MTPTNLELHLEELILHDFPHSQRYHIAAAIEQELTRLFTEQGVPPSLTRGGQVAQIDGGTFNVPSNAAPNAIGAQVAQAIYEGFG